MRTPLLLPLLVAALTSSGQTSNSFETRNVTGNGPYPIYIALQWVHNSNVSAFGELANSPSLAFGGTDSKIRQHGVEVSIGAMVNEDNFLGIHNLRVHRLSIETGYKFLERSFSDDEGRTLRTRQGLISLRFGSRWNFIYPLTLHGQIGPVLLHSARLGVREVNGEENAAFTRRIEFSGLDTRIRLVFFDPVGSTGGFSLFVEGQFIYSFNGPNIEPLRDLMGPPKSTANGDFSMGVLSVGTTIPLALRVR